MADDPRKHLISLLDLMAALSTWTDGEDGDTFAAAFTTTRTKALDAASAYVAAVKASHDHDLRGWLGDMNSLRRWADGGTPEAAPFVEALAAARERALAAAADPG
jgi:hypothetical protein